MQDDIELTRIIHAAIRRARQEGQPRPGQIDRAVKSLMATQRDLSLAEALRLVEAVQGERQCRGTTPSSWEAR